MYVHLGIYVAIVILQSILEFFNGERLDMNYHSACYKIHVSHTGDSSLIEKCKAAVSVVYD